MLHIQVDGESGERSPALPRNVELALRTLLQRGPVEQQGLIDRQSLEGLPEEQRAEVNSEDAIGEFHGCDVVAPSNEVLRLVLEGLGRRLTHPLADRERLRLVGGRDEPA